MLSHPSEPRKEKARNPVPDKQRQEREARCDDGSLSRTAEETGIIWQTANLRRCGRSVGRVFQFRSAGRRRVPVITCRCQSPRAIDGHGVVIR